MNSIRHARRDTRRHAVTKDSRLAVMEDSGHAVVTGEECMWVFRWPGIIVGPHLLHGGSRKNMCSGTAISVVTCWACTDPPAAAVPV